MYVIFHCQRRGRPDWAAILVRARAYAAQVPMFRAAPGVPRWRARLQAIRGSQGAQTQDLQAEVPASWSQG